MNTEALPKPKSSDAKHIKTLYHIIMNRQLTSVEISRLARVGYAPRKIQILEEKGIRFNHDLVPYQPKEGRKTQVARYTLLSPMKEAKKIYKQLIKV